MTEPTANSPAASPSPAAPAPPSRPSRWMRRFCYAFASLLLVLASSLAAFWYWAGSEGSLARVLSWGQRYLPPDALGIEGLQGALRRGGEVSHLRWHQGGLKIDVYDARYTWDPLALLGGQIRFTSLSARHIRVDDQRPPDGAPSSGPPQALGLPLKVQIDGFNAGKLEVVNPQVFSAEAVTGRYGFDGSNHRLHLDSAAIAQGTYQAEVRLGTVGSPDIDARLSGTFLSPSPEGGQSVPLSVNARVHGPLTEMRAEATVRGQAAEAGTPAASADATARITPWGEHPLPEAQAKFSDLDIAPFWPPGPQTRLTGQLDIAPTPAKKPAESKAVGWQVTAQITNALPGPWDSKRLPLDRLHTRAIWQDGVATVEALKAELAGGTLESAGSWSRPASTASSDSGNWQIVTSLNGIDPARLHTKLAPFPIDGRATASGAGTAIDFDVALQARANRQATPATRSGDTAAKALARDIYALRVQSAAAQGRWQEGLLRIANLRVRTSDAELTGTKIEARPNAPSGKGQIQLSAPGALIKLDADVAERVGGGAVNAQISDLSKTLSWIQKLPGVPSELSSAQASGQLALNGSWQGGWTDPSVKLKLEIPAAQWRADANANVNTAPAPTRLQETLLNLNGRLSQAELELRGTLTQDKRTFKLRASAEGGRSRAGATLAASSWQGTLRQLELSAQDPALSQGRSDAPWQVKSRVPVSFSWAPAPGAQGSGEFKAGAGELVLTAPLKTSAASPTTVAWQPLQWRAGTLSSSGRITGLPLAWAELFAGPQMAESGVTGEVIFDGQWNAQLGETMRIEAELARTRGDLVVTTRDADTGVQTRIAAGLKDARLQLRSEGQAITLKLNWDTEHLGVATGEVRSQLVSSKSQEGDVAWSWPESAPLSGEVRAALPRIGAWSQLAPPGWRVRGSLAANVRIAGTRGTPLLSGTLGADDLALRSVVDGIEFSGGRLRARLDGQRLILDEFSLRGGGTDQAGGSLRANGEAKLQNGQVQANMNATLDRLHASLRADRKVIVSGQLQASVAGRESTVNGKLRVDQARISLPEETAPTLGKDVIVRGPNGRGIGGWTATPVAAKSPNQGASPANTATLKGEVQIDLGEDFRVSGLGLNTRLAGQLAITASGAMGTLPRVTGTVNTIGGTFRAYSQQLNIDTGVIRFVGPANDPVFNILALRPNYQSDQRVGVQVTGSALLPRVRLYAQPELPDSEKLAWLILGRSAPSGGAESALLQQAAIAIMGGREGRSVASRFGLDELSFSGGGDTDTGTAGASVTLGKRISEKLYATYEHSLAGAMGTLFVYFELSKRWLLRGQAGERSALDLIYTLSFD
ncbi:translocation/assembly module TamB domain-containing protein [Ottowia thiooxydans]|uniref:translocation/assembly module TamB domain-containing protein n=1 Tax=Ottowia thiooxydans TaxID=219182 RepID=UPI00041DD969|nr:translocation/assembly module TamB domain-containing protein [Ottowia thiooxydans]